MSVLSQVAINRTYLDLQVNVTLEEGLLGAHPDGGTHNLACSWEIQPADLEFGKHEPQFCKGELFVWNQPQHRSVYLSRPVIVLSNDGLGRIHVYQKLYIGLPLSQFPRITRSSAIERCTVSNVASRLPEGLERQHVRTLPLRGLFGLAVLRPSILHPSSPGTRLPPSEYNRTIHRNSVRHAGVHPHIVSAVYQEQYFPA